MQLIRLKQAQHPHFDTAWQLYEASFPEYERRYLADHLAAMQDEDFHYCLITHDEGSLVGLVAYWQQPEWVYIEHLCTLPELRGQGLGRVLLDTLKAEFKRALILEIDPPLDALSQRRLAFYQRAGFEMNQRSHFHPSYRPHTQAHQLCLLSCPLFTESQLDEFQNYLRCSVMRYARA